MTPLRQSVSFEAPYRIEIIDEHIPALGEGQVLIQTLVSAISAGTELLFYRGQAPEDIQADSTIASLSEKVTYPLRYGYACVGRVIDVGTGVSNTWLDRLAFATC